MSIPRNEFTVPCVKLPYISVSFVSKIESLLSDFHYQKPNNLCYKTATKAEKQKKMAQRRLAAPLGPGDRASEDQPFTLHGEN